MKKGVHDEASEVREPLLLTPVRTPYCARYSSIEIVHTKIAGKVSKVIFTNKLD